MMDEHRIGFLGAGGIARSHAFALNSLKYFYSVPPAFRLVAVSSAREESRSAFAADFGFERHMAAEDLFNLDDIDAVFILGPNSVHYQHLEAAAGMTNVQRIYLEKPVCSNKSEEDGLSRIVADNSHGKIIQVGFQFLMGPAIREALIFSKDNDFGTPIHFSFTLKHRDYLNASYRKKRRTRLTPAPDGGAMADLGSHALSLMVAFLGSGIEIVSALQSGSYPDVPRESDLYSEISLFDPKTGAVGNVSGSRVSSGIGDMMAFEIFYEKGALRYNSFYPDRFEYFFEKGGDWSTRFTGSNYSPVTSFPSGHVPAGWLRALIHAHFVFLSGNDPSAFVPGLDHGIEVQRLVRETAENMEIFREKTGK